MTTDDATIRSPATGEERECDSLGVRVDAMLGCLARCAQAGDERVRLVAALATDRALLGELRALAAEFWLGERLKLSLMLDPVTPPLIVRCLSEGGEAAVRARRAVQAQAEFIETQRRMDITPDGLSEATARQVRATVARSVAANGLTLPVLEHRRETQLAAVLSAAAEDQGEGRPVPDLVEQGPALFLSAVSLASGLDRGAAAIATGPRQAGRMALMLRAAGLEPGRIARELLLLHGSAMPLPQGLGTLTPDEAAALAGQEC